MLTSQKFVAVGSGSARGPLVGLGAPPRTREDETASTEIQMTSALKQRKEYGSHPL